ncbi:MAG: UDP-N-acetylmuramoyl-tripeptide--D-alanyl-D-alanine ligase [Microscillaceae bacterium]|nr:UDP-N-acetylmuramoyl-tripeptide--D-alanyl-D-alanine ligase [Microscillaceae bacterium]
MEQLYQKYLSCTGVSTDTRKIEPGDLFFALKGPNFNGNAFARKALESGAKYLVLDEIIDPTLADMPEVILVDDALSALQELARHHRRQFNIPIIAVGGSNGKTTSKELIHKVLAAQFRTFATPGNLNNHIGVPLTLLQMPLNTQMAVIEMGANHAGEIAELCKIAEPNFGIITNIGMDHLEGFGSIHGVAQANGELYDFLQKNQGKIFVNTQEEMLVQLSAHFPEKITYPSPGDYFHAELIPSDFFLKIQTEAGETVQTQLFGEYNFANIATALCIGKYFGVKSSSANQAVAEYQPANQRSQLIEKRSNTIILDAYNANPSSMTLALQSFAKIKGSYKVVILGDMNELGELSTQEHLNLGKLLAELRFDLVILHGKEIQAALTDNPKAYYFPDKFSLHNWLTDRKLENAHVLIKGSRGMTLESVLLSL